MLSLMKKMFSEYKTLVVHMNSDLNHVVATKTNLKYLRDIEVIMGLTCIMPMLEEIHALIKFIHAHDTLCVILWLLLNCVVQNYASCILIQGQSMNKNISKHSWTCMITTMINLLPSE